MADHIAALLAAIDHARAGRHVEAERALRALLATEPDDAQALFLLGETTLVMGRMAEAADLLGRALQLRPMHRLTRIALARALLAADRAEENQGDHHAGDAVEQIADREPFGGLILGVAF